MRTGNKTPVVCWPQDTLEALLGVGSVVYCVQGEKGGNLEQFLFLLLVMDRNNKNKPDGGIGHHLNFEMRSSINLGEALKFTANIESQNINLCTYLVTVADRWLELGR